MAFKPVTSGPFTITGNNKLIKLSLADHGHIQFPMGEETILKNMAGSFLRLAVATIPSGTRMKFGSYEVTYKEDCLTVKNSRSLLDLPHNMLQQFSEAVHVAITVGDNVRLSRPKNVQSRSRITDFDTLSGMYSENI